MKKILIVLMALGLLCSYNISFGNVFKYEDGVIDVKNGPDKGTDYELIVKERYLDKKWELVFDNWYLDKQSITKLSNIVSVWMLHIITDNERELSGIPINKNINRLVSLSDTDCKNRMIRTPKIIGYDAYGNVIEVYEDHEWQAISPDSFEEIIFEKFCFTKNINMKIPSSVLGKSSSDWVKYSSDEEGAVSLYNKRNIIKSRRKDIVEVWEKWILSDEARRRLIYSDGKYKLFRQSECLSTVGCDNPSYVILLNQINCKNKKLRVLKSIEYDKDDNLLPESCTHLTF